MLLRKTFVSKSRSVYGAATRAVAICQVSALSHEARHDAVERTTTEVQATSILASAELPEVFDGAWHHIRQQFKVHAALGFDCTRLSHAFC